MKLYLEREYQFLEDREYRGDVLGRTMDQIIIDKLSAGSLRNEVDDYITWFYDKVEIVSTERIMRICRYYDTPCPDDWRQAVERTKREYGGRIPRKYEELAMMTHKRRGDFKDD